MMKRTKSINYDAFRKSWRVQHLTPVALVVTSMFILAGCEKSDENVRFYQNASDCASTNPGKSAQCDATYQQALLEAARTAPKYASETDCVAEFGAGQCQSAPAQSSAVSQPAQQAGSIWMPLMAGYMMGSMLSNGGAFAQQPMFSSRNPASPAYGQYTDAKGRSYGSATSGRSMRVSNHAFTPHPATTTTITRGGFGDSVAKQSSMKRSMGG